MGGNPSAVYHPRNPRDTALYAVIEDHLEEFIRVYDEKYQKEFGFWRPVIQEVMEKYLECGDLHHGFARVRCGGCAHEFLLAFSCKGRYFCPSCHQKRVVSFAEWAEQEALEKVSHRQYVFTIPKMLRIYFKYDRKLLGKLSQCAYETVKEFFQEVVPDKEAVPGVILSIQTYGQELNFHPHLHGVISDGCFSQDGTCHPIPEVDTQKMMELFRHKVFKMLLAEEKITETHIQKLLAWKHTGFSVYRGEKVEAEDKKGREHLASYALHPPMSQENRIAPAGRPRNDLRSRDRDRTVPHEKEERPGRDPDVPCTGLAGAAERAHPQ
jgi:transposase-like protein